MSELIELGNRRIPVVPQRHARLTHGFEKLLGGLGELGGDLSAAGMIAALGDKVYDALVLLVPTVEDMPRHEFMGYPTEQAMLDGAYDPDADTFSPTPAQIITAFEIAIRVSRFEVFKPLLKLVDPTLLSATVNAALAEQVEKSSLTETSPSSPSTSGA